MDYFISDLHFGHKNILAFDNRPWTDIESHDEALVENWNNKVGIDDDVYILGDISWHGSMKTVEIFKQLNGIKHLIKGNHDDKILRNRELQALFIEICDYKEIYIDNSSSIVLCHYPIPCFKNHYYKWVHLYGHVHNSFEWNMMEHTKKQMIDLYGVPCSMYNVGAMMPWMNYTPKTLIEIIDDYSNWKYKNT